MKLPISLIWTVRQRTFPPRFLPLWLDGTHWGPPSFPSQRRTLARACIDYILQSGPAGLVGRPWVGERLWAEQAVLKSPGPLSIHGRHRLRASTSLSPEDVQSSLALSDVTLRRFHSWASKCFPDDFKVLYVAEGGNQIERRKGVLEFVREIVEEAEIGLLILCGHVDEDIFFGALDLFNRFYFKMWEKTGVLTEELTHSARMSALL